MLVAIALDFYLEAARRKTDRIEWIKIGEIMMGEETCRMHTETILMLEIMMIGSRDR